MIDVTLKLTEKLPNYESYRDEKENEVRFEIEPGSEHIYMSLGGDDITWTINRRDFEMISKIIGGLDG